MNRYVVVSHCVLICVSLIINDGQHLFLCSPTTHLFSFGNFLFKYFAYFLIELIILLLGSKSSSYILDINPLSEVCVRK